VGARHKLAIFFAAVLAACSPEGASEDRSAGVGEVASAPPEQVLRAPDWVVDEAGVLDPDTKAEIASKLTALEARTGHQFVVVTVRSLGGTDIAIFAQDLGNRWGIGREDFDDGVILLVAPNEREVRIAVGHGLESVLTDTVCLTIIEQHMLPDFRTGDFASGISGGVDAVISTLR